MPEPRPIPREIALLSDLAELSAARAKAEVATANGYAARSETIRRDAADREAGIAHRAGLVREATESEYATKRAAVAARADADLAAARAEVASARKRTASAFESGTRAAKKTLEETRWEALALYEAALDSAKKRAEEHAGEVAEAVEAFNQVDEAAAPLLGRHARFAPGPPPEPAATADLPPELDPLTALRERTVAADAAYARLNKLALPKLVAWSTYPWPFIVAGLALAVPLGLAFGWEVGPASAFVAALLAAAALRPWLYRRASVTSARESGPLAIALAEGRAFVRRSKDAALASARRDKADAEDRRQVAVRRADEVASAREAELAARRDEETARQDATSKPKLAEIAARRDDDIKKLDEHYLPRIEDLDRQHEADSSEAGETHRRLVDANEGRHTAEREATAGAWLTGLGRVAAEVEALRAEDARISFNWQGRAPEDWQPPADVPPAIRFGEFRVDLAQIRDGIPRDEALRARTPESFTLPAYLPFPERGSLVVRAYDDGRDKAVDLARALMLRYLTALPAGKVRFTIVDPVGLGQNFAAFMHLADTDEALVTNRIWTESRHIEQRLVDLTEHMENVIQKYLRDEYPTIEDYNEQAGEVAEPFRVLVVANFPSNFTEAAARRLISIAAGGARCGVQVLITVDARMPLPPGIALKDLEQHATTLIWGDGKFRWRGSEFEPYPLALDSPPPSEPLTKLVQAAGFAAKDARRVEVPFEYIAPPEDRWWTGDSRSGIDVPLGKAGATRFQHLKLGKGTAQHVLIAGRTGSGKSTLLHALITNTALIYGPDEVEFYLIDFKKGVEFKNYATRQLPHARVVAIESEREFGLSVLQRLDHELKVRGDRFRDAGAQDVASYRRAVPDRPTPRILLVVDEFQEFFIEDDKLGQESALLLDRLVRQGRAFGIHVHLGSQTLSGAYSLARSTLGQMAVRIALQCSEADAHLILSEDNSAARLLSRPGEAIYNDANGMVEGNHIFQVVWLSDERREDYLRKIRELAVARNLVPATPAIVFEGNKPADVDKNPALTTLLDAPAWPDELPRSAVAWLGEAIAIKDATAATFRRQGGSNLLILGQQEESARSILAIAAVGLAAQHAPHQARFVILDGTPADSPMAGALARLADALPHPVEQVVAGRALGPALDALAAEIERRRAAGDSELAAESVFVLLHDLSRFRDLRKADDDYGFGGRYGEDKPAATPSQQLATILREGPAVGIHLLIWCDTLANVNRALDRQSLREFDSRVLFQMSAADSSNLIDAPTASRLGPNRAFLYEEEQGRLEKFRPYAFPTPDWLARLRDHLHRPAPAPSSPQG